MTGVAFTPDGRRILTSSRDETVRVWNADGGQLLWAFENLGQPVNLVAVSRDGRTIATAAGKNTSIRPFGGEIILWDVSP